MHRNVVLSIYGLMGGVDVFSINLAQELRRKGIPARILLSNIFPQAHKISLPQDIPVDTLPVNRKDSWPVRWRAMIRYLENQSPCIYFPNYDLKYSCVCSRLSDRIIVIGSVHSDEPTHYEQAMRLGKYWNGIVSVSDAITSHLELFRDGIPNRLKTIPYGVNVPDAYPERSLTKEQPLRIVYAGRLLHHQKRVLDLPFIFEKLYTQNIPIEFTVIGDGPERSAMEARCERLISHGVIKFLGALPNTEVSENFKKQDAIILLSDYEGLPIALLEAMAMGCIPVVRNIRSGIPELVQDHQNGFLIHQGETNAFITRFEELSKNLQLRQTMSMNAYQTIKEKYSLTRMVDDYLNFFQDLEEASKSGVYRRPNGAIPYPPWMKITWKDHLPQPLRQAGKSFKKFFHVWRESGNSNHSTSE